MLNVVQTGRRRSSAASANAYSTRAPSTNEDKNTRVSSRQTKGQLKDWREGSASHDAMKDTGIELVEVPIDL
jgi:hypothetical protein